MFRPDTIDFFRALLDAPGPAGAELAAARVWRREAATFAHVDADTMGNSVAVVNPQGTPTILLAAHIDEIGIMITTIDDAGFCGFNLIGGWDTSVLVGQRVRLLTKHGEILGVIGRKPTHQLAEDGEEEDVPTLRYLWIDIGASSGDEARAMVRVGDPGILDARALKLRHNRVVSRALDNRLGAFVVLEAARRYARTPGAARLLVAATVQEEIDRALSGAWATATATQPAVAFVVDTAHANDAPDSDLLPFTPAHPLESGPVIGRGAGISPVVVDLLEQTAESLSLPYTREACPTTTGGDADSVAIARTGLPTGLVEIPLRYMHTPNEMASLLDVEATTVLLAAVCRRISTATDFVLR